MRSPDLDHDSACLRDVRHRMALRQTPIARYDDPRRQIHEESDSGAQRDSKPEDTHQYNIDSQVSGEAGADPGNLLIKLVQH